MCFAIINEYERGLRFTLGTNPRVIGPGICLNIPFLHNLRIVDIRTKTINLPPQEVMTRDNVPLNITIVVYYQITKPDDAILKIKDIDFTVVQYAQTAMRDIIGKNEMDNILADRENIAKEVETIVEKEIAEWGADITAIKIQDIVMPEDMKRTMARQAEGERIRRSTVILAQGELEASKNYALAADTLSGSTGALYLKTLQTLTTTVSQEDAPTHIILVPSQLMKMFKNFMNKN